MEFRFSDEEERFRGELRAFLAEHPAPDEHTFEAGLEWQRVLHRGRWVAPHWPVDVGGRGCSPAEYVIFLEEMGRHRAPQLAGRVGVNMVGPTLLSHGSPEQRARYLPGILSGDHIWCEMFSEPDAGSDLAAAATRAIPDGDDWVINGSKVWSSFAIEATMGVVLAQTGSGAGRREFSYLICEMDRPGIDVRPVRQITGDAEFAEVFLDDVRVPLDAVIGQPGQGWHVMRTTLDNERGLAYPWKEQIVLDGMLDELLRRAAASRALDPQLRRRLVDDVIRSRIFRLLNLRTLSIVSAGESIGAFGSLTKLFWAEYAQHLQQTRFELGGASSVAGEASSWNPLLWYRQASIAGGTSEIQRNIIGERALGLPREPRG